MSTPIRPLDYASPRHDAPKPTAALWVAAGLVWAFCLLAAGACGLGLFLAAQDSSAGGAAIVCGIGVFVACVALIEWHACVRRSRRAALAICFLTGGYLSLCTLSIVANLASASARSSATFEDWIGLFGAAGIAAIAAFVAFAHASFASRLRQHSIRATRGEDA